MSVFLKFYTTFMIINVPYSYSTKLGTLRGDGGTFFLPSKATKKPVGEFQVNKKVGTVSGVFCDKLEPDPNVRMICTDENNEDSV